MVEWVSAFLVGYTNWCVWGQSGLSSPHGSQHRTEADRLGLTSMVTAGMGDLNKKISMESAAQVEGSPGVGGFPQIHPCMNAV